MPIDGTVHGMMEPEQRGKGSGAKALGLPGELLSADDEKNVRRLDRGMPMLLRTGRPLRAGAVIHGTKKVCVLGDPGVGKTSVIRRFALDRFEELYTTTVGARVLRKPVILQYPERSLEVRLDLMIWEISGQNRHLGLYPAFYRGAEGAIIVGDASRTDTQVNLWKWIEGFRAAAGRVPMVMLLNKTDLLEPAEFDRGIIEEISSEYGCPYRMTSARTATGLDGIFRELGYRLVGRKLLSASRKVSAC